MKLPPDTDIPWEKLTRYLLVPKAASDKSAWLARGGYTLTNAGQLREELRRQILPLDAMPSRQSTFGETFEICGCLRGPAGTRLGVRTIWIKDSLSGRFRFVTLIPLAHSPE